MTRFSISMLAFLLTATIGVTQTQAQCSRGQGSQTRGATGGGLPLQFSSSFGQSALQSPQTANAIALRMQQMQMQQQFAAMSQQASRERAMQAQQRQQEILAMRRERADQKRQARSERIAARIAERDAALYASKTQASQLVAGYSAN